MTTVFIHLGMPKTASTAMQEHVFPYISSHRLVHKGDFRDLILKHEDRPTIISYENFIGYPFINYSQKYDGYRKTRRASLAALSQLFPGAHTILIVREHVGLVKSLYNQFIKSGGSLSFQDFVGGKSEESLDLSALNYQELISDIKASIEGPLLVLDHRLLRENLSLFEKAFLDFIQSGDSDVFSSLSTKRSNESLSMSQIRSVRFMNSRIRTDFNKEGWKISRRGFKVARKLAMSVLHRAFSNADVYGDKEISVMEAYFHEDRKFLETTLEAGFRVF